MKISEINLIHRPQLLLAVILCLSVSCEREKPYSKETFVMGTEAWVTIYGLDGQKAEAAASEAFRELHRIEGLMSNWKKESEISLLNRESNGAPHRLSSELFHVISRALYFSDITAGAFDISARPLVQLWGFQGGTARLPADLEIDAALQKVGYKKIMLDIESESIILPPGMELDLAGIAKGYAVDRAVAILKKHGVERGMVNLGGNIYAIGSPPGKKGWSVGIRDPRGDRTVVGSLLLEDEAVATSGNYENYIEMEGQIYGHIIDPRIGRPVSHILSVTVVAANALQADALSTGLFVLGPEGSRDALELMQGIRALFALPNGETVIYEELGSFSGSLTLDDSH
jgi:thiamine biosynthesis lipoprotein